MPAARSDCTSLPGTPRAANESVAEEPGAWVDTAVMTGEVERDKRNPLLVSVVAAVAGPITRQRKRDGEKTSPADDLEQF